jgi:hypothetical protein
MPPPRSRCIPILLPNRWAIEQVCTH